MVKSKKKTPREVLHIRTFGDDKNIIKRKAKRYAKGNMSAWTLHTAKHHVPKPGEKIFIPYTRFLLGK